MTLAKRSALFKRGSPGREASEFDQKLSLGHDCRSLGRSNSYEVASQLAVNFSRVVFYMYLHISFCSRKEFLYIRDLIEILCLATEKRSLDNCLWTIAPPVLWDCMDFVCHLGFYNALLFARRIRTESSLMFLDWHVSEFFTLPPVTRREFWLLVPARRSEECELTRSLAVLTPPFFAYNSSLLMKRPTDDFVWNVTVAKHCALPFFSYLDSCRLGAPISFCLHPRILPAKYRGLGVICLLLFCPSEGACNYKALWDLSFV